MNEKDSVLSATMIAALLTFCYTHRNYGLERGTVMPTHGLISRRFTLALVIAGAVGLFLLLGFTLRLPTCQAAPAKNTPEELAYCQYMLSYIPHDITSAHWKELRTAHPLLKDKDIRGTSRYHYEGWFKGPDHFRHDYPSNWGVLNGTESWWYTRGDRSVRKSTDSAQNRLATFFRPDAVGCGEFYTAKDLLAVKETAGEYSGVANVKYKGPCTVIHLDFKPRIVDGPCPSATGPCHVQVYADTKTRRVLVWEREIRDIEDKEVVESQVRVFAYDVPLKDDLFTFIPPADSHMVPVP